MLAYLKDFKSYTILEELGPEIHQYIEASIQKTIRYYENEIQFCEHEERHTLMMVHARPVLERDFTPYQEILIRKFAHYSQLYTWKDRLPRSQYINRGAIY